MALDASACRTITVILRVFQLILGFISVGIVSYNVTRVSPLDGYNYISDRQEVVSFLIICSAYLTPCFLLLVSTIHRESAEHLRKTIFELLFNIFGAIIQFCAAVSMMVAKHQDTLFNNSFNKTPFYAAGAIAMINAATYGANIFVAVMAKRAP